MPEWTALGNPIYRSFGIQKGADENGGNLRHDGVAKPAQRALAVVPMDIFLPVNECGAANSHPTGYPMSQRE